MKVTITGVQLLDFIAKNDAGAEGEKIEGIKLHLTSEDPNVFGLAATTKFFKAGSPLYGKLNPFVNDLDSILNHEVNFDTDMKGRILSFEVLPLV